MVKFARITQINTNDPIVKLAWTWYNLPHNLCEYIIMPFTMRYRCYLIENTISNTKGKKKMRGCLSRGSLSNAHHHFLIPNMKQVSHHHWIPSCTLHTEMFIDFYTWTYSFIPIWTASFHIDTQYSVSVYRLFWKPDCKEKSVVWWHYS